VLCDPARAGHYLTVEVHMNKYITRFLLTGCALGFLSSAPQVALAHEEEPIPFPPNTTQVDEPAVSTGTVGSDDTRSEDDKKVTAIVIAGLVGAAAVAGSTLLATRKRGTGVVGSDESPADDAGKNL
jgi:hypothetical protein